MQIKVLDHIVIGNNEYFSFADEGLIEDYNVNVLSIKKRGKGWLRKKDSDRDIFVPLKRKGDIRDEISDIAAEYFFKPTLCS